MDKNIPVSLVAPYLNSIRRRLPSYVNDLSWLIANHTVDQINKLDEHCVRNVAIDTGEHRLSTNTTN